MVEVKDEHRELAYQTIRSVLIALGVGLERGEADGLMGTIARSYAETEERGATRERARNITRLYEGTE